MSFDTYSALQTEIAEYAQRSNSTTFVAKIPTFIKLAEQDIFRKLRSYLLESVETVNFSATVATAALPTRCREIKSVRLNGDYAKELRNAPLAALTQQYRSADAGTPNEYAIRGSNFVLFPTPAVDGTLSVTCTIAPEALSGSNGSNTVLASYPDLYFYGSLVHAFRFMRNQERMVESAQAFEIAMTEANKESKKLKSSGTADSMRALSRRRIV